MPADFLAPLGAPSGRRSWLAGRPDNPWGQTTWVSEDDFVDGGMAKASDNRLPDAYTVHLPQD
ncbi:hypothetical protein HZZ00_01985 [Streptomyces sp. NEAU-sy36]|uniref:hypothetical protein n=1 Tax=unclassified Streptomyces TaxID=2593676 RepID=UPI0015D58FC8|nr:MULTISPECIES: hypothetical protein [unclassified Streptomyces]QLI99506.1 hypothetical protein HZZ00_01985 [Streptomyces sp. NEAU-sy36]